MDPSRKVDQSSFELAKWVAIVSMVVDHYGKIVDPSLYWPTHFVGRIAFPLFAWIIASRLALRPDLAIRYMRWLLPWALVSQPVFYLAGREWYEPNILFELLIGVLVVAAWQRWTDHMQTTVIALAAAVAGMYCDYGPAGALAIPAMTLANRRGRTAAIATLAVFGLLANFPTTDPRMLFAASATLGAPLVALLSLTVPGSLLPRLPKVFFYAFYPAHLLAFALFREFATGTP